MTFKMLIVTLSCLIFSLFWRGLGWSNPGISQLSFCNWPWFVGVCCVYVSLPSSHATRVLHTCGVFRKPRAQSVSRSRCMSHNKMSSPDVAVNQAFFHVGRLFIVHEPNYICQCYSSHFSYSMWGIFVAMFPNNNFHSPSDSGSYGSHVPYSTLHRLYSKYYLRSYLFIFQISCYMLDLALWTIYHAKEVLLKYTTVRKNDRILTGLQYTFKVIV